MYNARGRYILMAIIVATGVICLVQKEEQLAALAGLMLALLVWSHFKQSSVVIASKQFKNGDYDRAEKSLQEVPNPDRLSKRRRGYYEFMKGSIALKREEYDEAERHFQIASRFPIGGKNDKAFVMIHLANLALRKKDKTRVMAYVAKAKELVTTPKATDIINRIEKEAISL
ncbi:tetratricopeptide repeat protein [Pedobacter duraquae]|uniref:Tetratricopeptide repeat protein n=1 Tax=Pedobacter duraquae TaxID=425511 RepID=A0A4R6IM35_9SPHI|nr:hypothetical protein [Pedobacter duraquae]TDO23224.1 hypothetical protein CLV32_2213 [Pedobacter duraquae]